MNIKGDKLVKKLRFVLFFVLLVCSITACSTCFGESFIRNTGETVYMTSMDKRYHKFGCIVIQGINVHSSSSSVAEIRGFTPCGICH